jgi:hypothetical protein
VGRDGQLRHFSIAVRRFGHSVAAAGAARAGFGCLAYSRTAMRLRKRSARPRSYWGPSPVDRHANQSDRRVARTHSSSPAPVRIRVLDMAQAPSGTCQAVPSHGRRAAKSSRWALRALVGHPSRRRCADEFRVAGGQNAFTVPDAILKIKIAQSRPVPPATPSGVKIQMIRIRRRALPRRPPSRTHRRRCAGGRTLACGRVLWKTCPKRWLRGASRGSGGTSPKRRTFGSLKAL